MLNESPDCDTNDVFGEHVTTAFTGATHIIDARFAREISPKITFVICLMCFRFSVKWKQNMELQNGLHHRS